MTYQDEIDERVKKLPKWAQTYIYKLERDIEYHKNRVREVSTGESVITWDEFGIRDEPHGIPSRARVFFDVIGGKLEICIRDGMLDIRADGVRYPVVLPYHGAGLRMFVVDRVPRED